MLGMRLSTSVNSTKEEELSKEQVLRGSIKNLLTHHQQVYGKIKDYKTALNMAKKSFKHLENVSHHVFINNKKAIANRGN